MEALRNSKKISLLAVAILFLFTFFNLILNAPRTINNQKIASLKEKIAVVRNRQMFWVCRNLWEENQKVENLLFYKLVLINVSKCLI